MKYTSLFTLAAAMSGTILAGCQTNLTPVPSPDPQIVTATPVAIMPTGEVMPGRQGVEGDPRLWIDSANPSDSLILGTAVKGALEAYRLDGTPAGITTDRPIALFDIRREFPLAGNQTGLILGFDASISELVAFTLDSENKNLRQISAEMPKIDAAVEGLCLYQSPVSGEVFAFTVGNGLIQQWVLSGQSGMVTVRHMRTVPVGFGAARCTADDQGRALYVTQEGVGLWKIGAEPESEGDKRAVDLAEPFGALAGDVKGLSVRKDGAGGGYLLATDADAGLVRMYNLQTLEPAGALSITGLDEAEGVFATSTHLSDDYRDGLLIVGDEDNHGKPANYKLLAWSDVASALGLENSGNSGTQTRPALARTVTASAETTPVRDPGDAADDPAIWVHPDSPDLSVIIGTQKRRGINVYDMSGNLIQARADGRINNVDLRYGFSLAGQSVDVVTASNRTTDGISIYIVDVATRRLVDVADGLIPTGMEDPYGLCMYRSQTGQYYVIVNDKDGIVKQWQLEDKGGRIGANLVREFDAGSQMEGCAADDETGDLYLGEENVGIWKYSAEPDGGETRTMVDSVGGIGKGGYLTADVEGLAIYYGANGSGYLIASNQGADNFAVYERTGDNKFIGLFHVVADGATGIDGASETDGLDVTSASLGRAFPHGALIVQDGRNIMPDESQNYKFVAWEEVAAVLDLETYTGYNPRTEEEN